jgi:hypothetical protein
VADNVGQEPYKDEIIQLFQDGMSSQNIAAHIWARHGISVAERTIKSRMQEWQRNRAPSNTHSALGDRVTTLFFEHGLEDKEMLRFLQDEGFDINPWGSCGEVSTSTVVRILGGPSRGFLA